MRLSDITEKASADFIRLFDQVRDGAMLVDLRSSTVIGINQGAEALLGRHRDEIAGLEFNALVPQVAYVDLVQAVRSSRNDPLPQILETFLIGRNQERIPVELQLSQLDFADGEVLLVVVRDKTDSLKMQQDLALMNTAMANVTTGVTIADARQPDMPLIYVNPGFEALTGYSGSEVLGRSCRFLQGNECQQPGLDELRQALKKGEACIVRLRNFKKDGSLFYNELRLSPVRNPDGELTHFVGVQLDVTNEVRALESLERSERQSQLALEREAELNDIKSKFISMVSHEFRTPMTGMNASASLIRNFGDRLGTEKTARHLLNIETSLKRMNRLLDDIFFFSKAEAGKIRVDVKPLQVNHYFEELIEQLSPIYPEREVRFMSEIAAESEFMLDKHLLNHVFLNLIGNALKYSPPDTLVHCVASEKDGLLTVKVIDSGIGIPNVDHGRLFEAFHRAGNVGTRQGTGMGLNIAVRAIELLEGSLTFSSRENQGSTFVVRLPVSLNPVSVSS